MPSTAPSTDPADDGLPPPSAAQVAVRPLLEDPRRRYPLAVTVALSALGSLTGRPPHARRDMSEVARVADLLSATQQLAATLAEDVAIHAHLARTGQRPDLHRRLRLLTDTHTSALHAQTALDDELRLAVHTAVDRAPRRDAGAETRLYDRLLRRARDHFYDAAIHTIPTRPAAGPAPPPPHHTPRTR